MKERPILFSTEMVKAILAGRKTQTRRIIKPQPSKQWAVETFCKQGPGSVGAHDLTEADMEMDSLLEHCRYGNKGDVLYVREKWFPAAINGDRVLIGFDPKDAAGSFSITTDNLGIYWKHMAKGRMIPSIHMPREASRIWLEVTGVRAERLQDISPADACDEGINYWNIDADAFEGGELQADFENYDWRDDPAYEDYHFPTYANPVDSFFSLWRKINGKASLEANPWVWVISFRVLSTTGKPEHLKS